MPIKDPFKRREYQRELMRKKRQGLTENVSPVLDPSINVSPVSPPLDPVSLVSPQSEMLDPAVSPVRPAPEKLDLVRPVSPNPAQAVSPCSRNHHSLTDLFQQATEKIKQDYQAIYKDSETPHKCFDCHNRERNYQILLNLLEKYWAKAKRLQKGGQNM